MLRYLVALAVFCLQSTAASAALPAEPPVDLDAGRKIYDTHCAVCHGPTGRPDLQSPAVQALPQRPADLSDPLFNSREPVTDWRIVVTHGGPALGLSAVMPSQQGNLSDQDIRNVVAYAKTLADTSGYPPGELNFFLPIRTRKAFLEDEVVWKSRWTEQETAVWRNVLEVEKRLGRRGQAILEVIHEDSDRRSEITEVEIGYKHALAWNAAKQSILSAALLVAIPTESGASEEISPYLAYGRQWSDRAVVQASARAIVPVDDANAGELELAGALHWRWTLWPRRVFPGVELTAVAPFEDDGGDDVQFTIVPQVRIGLTRLGHVALNLGVEVPLSDQGYDWRGHLYLLWDFADGSFFKGW